MPNEALREPGLEHGGGTAEGSPRVHPIQLDAPGVVPSSDGQIRRLALVGHPNDFWIILSVMGVVSVGFFVYFRYKRWL